MTVSCSASPILLRGQADAVRFVHRLEHVRGERANALVHLLTRFPFARKTGWP